MIYGTRAVMEAIRAGKEIEKIMIQSGLANDLIKELITLSRERRVPYTFVPQEKLKRLSSKNHQGVICLLSSVSYASLDNLVDRAYSEGREPLLLILDRITDVRNFGAIARTAECAGMDGIVIGEKIRLVFHHVGGSRIRVGIEAPADVSVLRDSLPDGAAVAAEIKTQIAAGNVA